MYSINKAIFIFVISVDSSYKLNLMICEKTLKIVKVELCYHYVLIRSWNASTSSWRFGFGVFSYL